MLRFDAIPEPVRILLVRLAPHPALQDFALGGGTSLALRFGHRLSVDLDFFTTREFSPEELIVSLDIGDFTIRQMIGFFWPSKFSFFTWHIGTELIDTESMEMRSGESRFQTTMWSVVLRAGNGDEQPKQAALDHLCRLYWKPLYVYCLRKGLMAVDAEDLTQAFFARLLARDTLRVADPARGRFRAFLITSFKHFIAGEGDRARAGRRGGGAVHFSFDVDFQNSPLPIHSPGLSPERAFDRQWALDLVERATTSLRAEYEKSGKKDWFDRIVGPSAGTAYSELAVELSSTEDAVKSFAKRARRKFRGILEREIADTVSSPEDAAQEMSYLVELLRA